MRRERESHLRGGGLRASANHDPGSGRRCHRRRGRNSVSPGNVGELASAILELYRHPEMVERMGVAARRRVVENFTWDHFRERLLGAYELAMGMAR